MTPREATISALFMFIEKARKHKKRAVRHKIWQEYYEIHKFQKAAKKALAQMERDA